MTRRTVMNKYLVKLTPYEKFFFGGENTFGNDNANYFVTSNYYPQQSTLIGLVRYQLLVQSGNSIFNDNKIVKLDKAVKLIGEKSFELGVGDNFGAISSISPVFISGKLDSYWFPANKEYQLDNGSYNFMEFERKFSGKSHISEEKKFLPTFKDYKPKLGIPDLLMDKSLRIKKYIFDKENSDSDDNGIFIENQQVGIRKNYKGLTDDKNFFVQVSYRLLRGYSFAFILELKDEVTFESEKIKVNFNSNNLVTIGADQSKFKMEVSEFKNNFDDLIPEYKKTSAVEKVVIVSDTYVSSNDIFNVCDFAITDTTDFKSLKTATEQKNNYADLGKSKSGKFNLIKKGSVFYGNTNQIEERLKNESIQKFGFNNLKIINKS